MESGRKRIGYPEWLILVGGSVFVAVLALSAYWEKDIRWLHFFQAWMYIAAMALVIVGSPWGHFNRGFCTLLRCSGKCTV
jgi:hypothetical protein